MNAIEKFQSLLNELFQFEASDLDFGIYRILNYKREQIDKFIKKDIKNQIEEAFARHKDERLKDISKQFEEAKRKVSETLGTNAFTPAGDIKPEFANTPVGKDYLQVKEQRDLAHTIDEIKLQVFNDLYSFFYRYYEEGDFIPQYRYSIKSHKYAIPFNGEEVKLYWTNADQYYTKTGMLFRDYTFYTDPGKAYKIIFRTVSAKEELSSNKATKARFFILDNETPLEKENEKNIIIRFQYRELTDKEVKGYGVEGGSNTAKQEKINQKIFDEILKQIKDTTLKGFLGAEYKNEKSLLHYQISRFTAKNTKDYFIHKNLKRFLSEQLDYFIKADVLSIMTLENEPFLDKHITRAKVVREIGEKIIDFLAQIEDFQKRLWEKKKFVLKTDYVITTDRVPEEFHKEILNNKNQLKEWKELGFIEDVIPAKAGIQNKKLPIDTKYFSEEFKERLLEKVTENADLDDLLDGVLIKSENFQALNLLLNKYRGQIKCTYNDPPYNTGSDEFLYRDNYQHSSWISMISNRLEIARMFLKNDGAVFISIDDNEVHNLKKIMFDIFGGADNSRTFAVKMAEPTGVKMSNVINEGGIARLKEYVVLSKLDGIRNLYMEKISKGEWDNEYKTIIVNASKEEVLELKSVRDNENRTEQEIKKCDGILKKFKTQSLSDYFKENKITGSKEQEEFRYENAWRIIRTCATSKDVKKNADIKRKKVKGDFFTVLTSKNKMYILTSKYDETQEEPRIKILFADDYLSVHPGDFWQDIKTTGLENEGKVKLKSGKKPERLLRRIIEMGSNNNDYVLDIFLGSGTTASVSQKVNRKWIGVEMGDYYEDLAMKRMKYCLAGEQTGISKEVNWQGGGFFKYQVLEQYEDALDNIVLSPKEKAPELFGDDYLLKYFLDFETQESPYLMNIEHLKSPFSYKLKVNLEEVGEPQEFAVDIPETFNYLLGLKMKRIKARQNQKNKYLFILGEKDGINTAIVWRNFDDKWDENDYKKDRDFIINGLKAWMPHRVYINGQSVLTTTLEGHTIEIHYIEPEFKTLMLS